MAAVVGDSSHIDMSVGDIYGGDYKEKGLMKNYIASSFGRIKDYGP
jgi:pantothenate kinase